MTSANRRGLIAAVAVASPVLVGVAYSALAAMGLAGPAATEAGTRHLARVLTDSAVWSGVLWSIWVGVAATGLAVAGAILVAAAYRGVGRTDRVARALAVLPLPVPHLVAALLGVQILGQSGLLARIGYALGWVAAPAAMPALTQDPAGLGLIAVLAWKEFPFLALLAMMVLASRGDGLEETARTLGALPGQAFARVTWPILWRGMLPGTVAVGIFVVGTYEATALLAPAYPLALPLAILERSTDPSLGVRGEAHVLALAGVGISLVAVAVHEWARALVERIEA